MALDPRHQWGAAVTRLIAEQPRLCEAVSGMADDQGRVVVVPVLATDSIVDVTRLVAQAGGRGTVVVLDEARTSIGMAQVTGRTGDAGDDCHVPVTAACSIGDLMAVLMPDASITYRITEDAELVIASPSHEDLDGELDLVG